MQMRARGGIVFAMRAHAFWPLKGLYKAEKMLNFELESPEKRNIISCDMNIHFSINFMTSYTLCKCITHLASENSNFLRDSPQMAYCTFNWSHEGTQK